MGVRVNFVAVWFGSILAVRQLQLVEAKLFIENGLLSRVCIVISVRPRFFALKERASLAGAAWTIWTTFAFSRGDPQHDNYK